MQERGVEPLYPAFNNRKKLKNGRKFGRKSRRRYCSVMVSTSKKQGRPTALHRMSDGSKIDGLSKLADGRWKISPGPGIPKAIKFTERNELLAVAKFNELRDRASKPEKVEVAIGTFSDPLDRVLAGLQAWGEGHKDVRLHRSEGSKGSATIGHAM